MSLIIAREELRTGLYLALLIPWPGIEFSEARGETVAALAEQIADVLEACADPDQARAALVGSVGR